MAKNLLLPIFLSFLSFNPFRIEDINFDIVDVQKIIPTIAVELKYASEDNCTHQKIYQFERCFLHKRAALQLKEVQEELEPLGLSLKIWDGFRPLSAQRKLWEVCPDPRYVSPPEKGGRHTRGTAVDLTLITKDGKELAMPSSFDDFSEKAHRDYKEASPEEIANRELLQILMEKHGFIGLSTEWWHFDLVDWEEYPPLQ